MHQRYRRWFLLRIRVIRNVLIRQLRRAGRVIQVAVAQPRVDLRHEYLLRRAVRQPDVFFDEQDDVAGEGIRLLQPPREVFIEHR